MSPKQKQLSDKLISIVTIALISLLAIVVMVFLLNEIEERTAIRFFESSAVEKLKPLDSNEVAAQRVFLPSDSLFVPASEVTEVISLSTRLLMENETYTTTNPRPPFVPQDLVVQAIENSGSASVNNQAYIKANSDIVVTAVSSGLKANNSTSDKVFSSVLSGTVSGVDVKGSVITLINHSNSFSIVTLTPSTRIFINGRIMLLDDIKIGDKLRVEGETAPGSTVTSAQVIAITGTTEIINIR